MMSASVPGAAMAVIKDGSVLWNQGFGVADAESHAPVTDRTLFEAASISKTVFAYAVMKLCEKRVLDLDAPLVNYEPNLFSADPNPQLKLITVRHVLSHTTGFPDWRSKEQPLRPQFAPGTKFNYSGEGYYYLQSIVTKLKGHVDATRCARYEMGFEVCGTDIDDYLKKQVLRPLGMGTSGYLWDDTLARYAARPHDEMGRPLKKKKPSPPDVARYASSGGLHTTTSEFARFLLEIMNPKPADDFRLSAATRREMVRPQVKLDPNVKIDGATSWALGWAVQERPTGNVIVHSGGQQGFKSLTMASLERKSGFILLTNAENGWKIFMDDSFQKAIDALLAR